MRPLKDIRVEVRNSIKRRGPRKFDVWTVFASKGASEFVLDGSPNTRHLTWMEGDSDVVSYEIPTQRSIGSGNENPQATIPDAICQMRSGKTQWREVKTDADAEILKRITSDQIISQTSLAEKYGAEWVLISTSIINKHAQLIDNWEIGLAYLWSSSGYDLKPYMRDIYSIMSVDKSMSVGQIISSFRSDIEPLYIAAIFRLSQLDKVITDLATNPFGQNTVVRRNSYEFQ